MNFQHTTRKLKTLSGIEKNALFGWIMKTAAYAAAKKISEWTADVKSIRCPFERRIIYVFPVSATNYPFYVTRANSSDEYREEPIFAVQT